ncbi:MAG: hypothetical protein ACRD88_08495, partial [Terriglobia bacterium]
ELGHAIPLPQGVEEAIARKDSLPSEQAAPEPWAQWLAMLDLAINPHKLRSYVTNEDAPEPTVVALIRFAVAKKSHTEADRDKVDWLLTHLFKKREEQRGLPTGWPRVEVQEILRGYEFPVLSQYAQDVLMEVPVLLDEIKYFSSFHQITDSRAVERGRDLKNQFGKEFFHPDVMAAVVNYNLLLGKKFYGLIQEISQKVHEFAQAQPTRSAPDTDALLRSDYRSAAEAFRNLGELGRKEPGPVAREAKTAAPPPATDSLEQQLKRLGVDPAHETQHLRSRIQDLSIRFRSNLTTATVPNPVSPFHLQEWEAGAFRSQYPESEQTFRAEFARSVRYAIAVISRIYEEIPLYHEKKSTEYLWKKHYDALVFLLYEGRRHKEALLKLSAVSRQRGLMEKAKQLQVTAENMDGALVKAAAIF